MAVVKAVGAAQQQEPRPEHVGVERRRDTFGLAALHVAAHRGEPRREPADDTEAVQDVGGVAQVAVDGGAVGLRAVGDDDLHAGAPAVALGGEEPAQRLSGPVRDHGQQLTALA